MRENEAAGHRLDVEHVRARSRKKRERRTRRGNRGEVDEDVRLASCRRSRRGCRGKRIDARRIAVEIDRRARAERERSKATCRRNRTILVEPMKSRVVPHRERARQVAHVLERHGSTTRHGERARRVPHRVDGGRDMESFAAGVDCAAVGANPDVNRCVDQAVIRGIAIDLDTSTVQNDGCRCGTLVGYAPRLERAAVEVQRAGRATLEPRPFAGRDQERAASLDNRRRTAAKSNLKIAGHRPVSTGLVHCECVEHHVALTRDVRVRGIEVALEEVACLGRRDVDGAKIAVGVIVQVVKNKMASHVMLENVMPSQGCMTADGQVPRRQGYCIEAGRGTCPRIANADEVLVVVAGVAGIIKGILALSLKTPIPSIRNVCETQPCVFGF